MLNYFYEKDYIRFSTKQPKSWQEAIQMSCQNLLEKSVITQVYVDEIIQCIEKYGPYIVLMPGVAMPHSSEQSLGVLGTAISLTIFDEAIPFEKGNTDKSAKLFFTLAAKNPEEHTENIAKLAELLMQEGLVDRLLNCKTIEDYLKVTEMFNI